MEQKKCENPACTNYVDGKTKNGSIRRYCSKKCSNSHNSIKSREKFKATCLEKFGGCGSAAASIKEKVENTNVERYGYKSYLSTEDKKSKTIETNIERYGVTHHLKSEISKQRQKDTNLEKYGVENVSQLENVKGAKIQTSMKNYGVSHHFKNNECIVSRKNTCMEKYGQEYPNSGRNFKDYKFPSGKIIRIQGYENRAIDELLQKYNENEILTGKLTPRIKYIGLDSKTHLYYPDIYIPKDNLIIEVKSSFTYKINEEVRKLKEDATRAAGYSFEYRIYE